MSEEITQEQWEQAKAHFDEVIAAYRELRGTPGVNVEFSLVMDLEPMEWRYDVGERSRELYDEMMAVE